LELGEAINMTKRQMENINSSLSRIFSKKDSIMRLEYKTYNTIKIDNKNASFFKMMTFNKDPPMRLYFKLYPEFEGAKFTVCISWSTKYPDEFNNDLIQEVY
jgi:hypothetical protein